MIDTVKDVVIGDVGDEVVSTGGVAVRPFWWSTECIQALGFGPGETGTDTTAGPPTSADTTTATAGESETGDQTGTTTGTTTGSVTGSTAGEQGGGVSGAGSEGREGEEGGLAGWLIALIAVLAAIAVASLSGLAYLLGKTRGGARGQGPTTGSVGGSVMSGAAASAPPATQGLGATPAPAFCTRCGNPLGAAAQFCANCGQPVDRASSQP